MVKRETSFTSQRTPQEIMSKIEDACGPLGFNVRKQNYKVHLWFLARFFILTYWVQFMQFKTYTGFNFFIFQMKLKGDKTGRKGHLSVATEVPALLSILID